MGELDAICRGMAIGIILLLARAGWSVRPGSAIASIWLCFSLAASAHILSAELHQLGGGPLLQLSVGILALSAPFFFWLFAQIMFEDDFRLRRNRREISRFLAEIGQTDAKIFGSLSGLSPSVKERST